MEEHSKSIIVENEYWSCVSGDQMQCRHHLIFGNGMRELSEEDGLWIPLTHDEHNMGELVQRIHDNSMAEYLSRMAGQLAWEGDYYRRAAGKGLFSARRVFRQRYGKSYL